MQNFRNLSTKKNIGLGSGGYEKGRFRRQCTQSGQSNYGAVAGIAFREVGWTIKCLLMSKGWDWAMDL